MVDLRLGVEEKYEISEEMILKYNIKEGKISPFTGLMVIDLESKEEEIDIKRPSVNDDVDIKKISSKEERDDIDIKKISKNTIEDDDIDIKKI